MHQLSLLLSSFLFVPSSAGINGTLRKAYPPSELPPTCTYDNESGVTHCTHPLKPTGCWKAPEIQRRYEVESSALGAGSGGEVRKAWDRQDRRFVAVKQTLLNAESSNFTKLQRRLEKEVALSMQVSGEHRNILSTHEVYAYEDGACFVMDLMDGDLEDHLRRRGTHLYEFEARIVISQVAAALSYLHERNIAHNDVKPKNVLVVPGTGRGRVPLSVVLADFGSLREFPEPESLLPWCRCGSQLYAPPRLTLEAKFGVFKEKLPPMAQDLYALGVMAVRITHGKDFWPVRLTAPLEDLRREIGAEASVEKLPLVEAYRLSPEFLSFTSLLINESSLYTTRPGAVLSHPWLLKPHSQLFEGRLRSLANPNLLVFSTLNLPFPEALALKEKRAALMVEEGVAEGPLDSTDSYSRSCLFLASERASSMGERVVTRRSAFSEAP